MSLLFRAIIDSPRDGIATYLFTYIQTALAVAAVVNASIHAG